MNNIFEILKTLDSIDLRRVKIGDVIYKCVDKNNLILVTLAKCVEENDGQVMFKDLEVLYVNIKNYQQRYESTTFARKRRYEDFKFLKLSKDITPEYFL